MRPNLTTWWKIWGNLVLKLLSIIGSIASLVGVLFYFLPSPKLLPWWAIALLVFAGFCLIGLFYLEISSNRGRRIYATSDTAGIRQYMYDWINHGGRVAIWTRDMSWADNYEMRQMLKNKAQRKELVICLPKLNEIAKELLNYGAEVYAYGMNHSELPDSRFTIAYLGRVGTRVAVGHADGKTHIIDEFDSGNHPAFYLAMDLVKLARSQCSSSRFAE